MPHGFLRRLRASFWSKLRRQRTYAPSLINYSHSSSAAISNPKLIKVRRAYASSAHNDGKPQQRQRRQCVTVLDIPDEKKPYARPGPTSASIRSDESIRDKLYPITMGGGQERPSVDRRHSDGVEGPDSKKPHGIGHKLASGVASASTPSFGSYTENVRESHKSSLRDSGDCYTSSERDERGSMSSCNCSSCRHKHLRRPPPPSKAAPGQKEQLILLIDSDVSLEISDGKGRFISYDSYIASRESSRRRGSKGNEKVKEEPVYVVPRSTDVKIKDSPNGDTSAGRNHQRSHVHGRTVTYGYGRSESAHRVVQL